MKILKQTEYFEVLECQSDKNKTSVTLDFFHYFLTFYKLTNQSKRKIIISCLFTPNTVQVKQSESENQFRVGL